VIGRNAGRAVLACGVLIAAVAMMVSCSDEAKVKSYSSEQGRVFHPDLQGLDRWDGGPGSSFDLDVRGPQRYYQPRQLPAGWTGPRL
jgi:hypothetical protein